MHVTVTVRALLIALMLTLSTASSTRSQPSPAAARPANVLATHDRYLGHIEPSLAMNPRDSANLLGAAQYFPASGQETPGTFVSFDGGRSWRDNGPLPLPAGYIGGFDVTVAFTPRGTGFVAADLTAGLRNRIFVWRTDTGGRRFERPAPVGPATHRPRFTDHPWLAADSRGFLSVAWAVSNGQSNAQLLFSRSTNNGHTFSAAQIIRPLADRFVFIPVLVAGPSGTVSVFYVSTDRATPGSSGVVKVATSPNRGTTFGTPHAIVSVRLPRDPLLQQDQPNATAGRDGTLYLVVPWYRPRAQRTDIMLTRSRDGGKTWSALTRVDREPGADRADHLHPQVVTTPRGIVYVSYDAVVNGRINVFLARSTNHGTSFQAGRQMTDVSFRPPTRLGEYEGLAASDTAVHLVWTDTRTGRREIVAATVPAQ